MVREKHKILIQDSDPKSCCSLTFLSAIGIEIKLSLSQPELFRVEEKKIFNFKANDAAIKEMRERSLPG